MKSTWPLATDLMTPNPQAIEPEAPLATALGHMRRLKVHELPVLRKGRELLGMVSYDALMRRHNVALSTKVEHLMVVAPTVSPSSTYPEIAHTLLSSGRRAAFVVPRRGGGLLGVVSRTDLVRALPELPAIAQVLVEEAMSPVPVTLNPRDPCRVLFAHTRILEDHPLPVVDSRRQIVGVVSLSDFGNAFWRTDPQSRRNVGEETSAPMAEVQSIMSVPALVVDPHATTGEAARLMSRQRASSVFVVEGGQPIGVVSQGDLLALAIPYRATSSGAYVQISGLGTGTDPALLSELDNVLARQLKRLGRFSEPRTVLVHVSAPSGRQPGHLSVRIRVRTLHGNYLATSTDWNLPAAARTALEEIERQIRQEKERRKERPRREKVAMDTSDLVADPDLENCLRQAMGPEPRAR
jgi:CBS domain-containing protein/ribosome-associated translation inhibitor RaiA